MTTEQIANLKEYDVVYYDRIPHYFSHFGGTNGGLYLMEIVDWSSFVYILEKEYKLLKQIS